VELCERFGGVMARVYAVVQWSSVELWQNLRRKLCNTCIRPPSPQPDLEPLRSPPSAPYPNQAPTNPNPKTPRPGALNGAVATQHATAQCMIHSPSLSGGPSPLAVWGR